MIQAIFFDIDGTLVSFNTHKVPQSAADAIKECQKKGIKAFICTGRPIILLPNFMQPDFGNLCFDGIVAQNGGYCSLADGKVIFSRYLDHRDVQALITYMDNQQNPFPVSMMTEEGVFINYIDDNVLNLAKMINVKVPMIRPLSDLAQQDVLQINIYAPADIEQPLTREVLSHCESSRWHPNFADINVVGNTKATGIDKMLAHFKIDISESMAFGDGGNDIPMLEHVAVGVAMGNSEEEVLARTRYHTDTVDNDGVARFLQTYFA